MLIFKGRIQISNKGEIHFSCKKIFLEKKEPFVFALEQKNEAWTLFIQLCIGVVTDSAYGMWRASRYVRGGGGVKGFKQHPSDPEIAYLLVREVGDVRQNPYTRIWKIGGGGTLRKENKYRSPLPTRTHPLSDFSGLTRHIDLQHPHWNNPVHATVCQVMRGIPRGDRKSILNPKISH